jgi:hypothetical protein
MEIIKNAWETVQKVNKLAVIAGWGDLIVSSGWRPAAVNATIKGAAPKSNHLTGRAVDLADPDRSIGRWCIDNQNALEKVGLWLEHPDDTPTWCHLQTVSPKSGNRVFRAK